MNIKLLVMDVDGTLTDGKIYIDNSGESFKAFSVKDGYGIHDILPKNNIIPIIITGRVSEIVEKRCKELNIVHYYQGINNKAVLLKQIAAEFHLTVNENDVYDTIAYMGDDLNDIDSMKLCAVVGCPQDAVKSIKDIATYISTSFGGDGAVREFIDWLVMYKK